MGFKPVTCQSPATPPVLILKSTIVPLHATKTYTDSRGIAPPTLMLDASGGEWSTTRPLYPRKEPQFPLYRWPDRPHGGSGRFSEQKNLLLPPVLEPRTV